MRFTLLVLLVFGLSAAANAQPVAPSRAVAAELSVHQVLAHYLVESDSLGSTATTAAPVRIYIVSPDKAEAAAWGAMLLGSASLAAIGWYVVGAGLRLDAESDGAKALRTVMLGLGGGLAIAATSGAGYAGYRLVIALR